MDLEWKEIEEKLSELLDPLGLECYPFKIGWYNEKVQTAFRLNFPDDTLAFVIISTPKMFDNAFKPYIWREDCLGNGDLLDRCMRHYFCAIRELFANTSVDCIHDYELNHSRRPKILVQTAAHVAGAVYYYQQSDIENPPWNPEQKMYGVCIHPMYGGWFAIRGALIFRNIKVPELEQRLPPDIIPDNRKRIELLEQFNFHYQDWQFRDAVFPAERYSEQQKEYFITPPPERTKLIEKIKSERPSSVDVSCR